MQNKSQKEIILEEKIQKLVADIVEYSDIDDNLPVRMMKQLLENEEIKAIQDYANTVSITRLGLNDHGPVHMRTVLMPKIQSSPSKHLVELYACVEGQETKRYL